MEDVKLQRMTRAQLLEKLEHHHYRETLFHETERIAHIGYYEWNYDLDRLESCSEEYAHIFNMSVDEVLAAESSWESTLEEIHPDDRDRYKALSENLRNTHSLNVEFRIIRNDGEVRYIRKSGVVVADEDGRKRRTFGIIQDITDLKNIESQLIESKNSLEFKVENRTRELAHTVLKLQEARNTLEDTVKARTQELADSVSQLQEEIKEREKISAELKFLANRDALTGLPSLRLCKDRLERSLAESRRNNKMTAVMFVDLDGFKAVNDTYGHECGDDVLKITADRVKAGIRETDTVARIGGDEFLVILSQISDAADTQRVAGNIIAQISQVILIDQVEISVGASLGISIYPDDGTSADQLIRRADKAMYLIKHSGKNNFGYTRSTLLN